MKVAIEVTDKAYVKICGLTVLERIILTAKKSGISKVVISDPLIANSPYSSSPLMGEDLRRGWKTVKANRIIHPDFFRGNNKVLELKTSADIRKAENLLLQWCRKPTDGIISRYLNRTISTSLSRYLVKLPLTPNHMTYFALLIGLVSAICALKTNFLWGFIFFQIASILDGCDGEMAKLKMCQSPYGAWLDTVSDNVTYLLFIISYGWGLSQYYHESFFLYLSAAACFFAGVALVCMYQYLSALKKDKTLVLVERAIHDLGKRKKMMLSFLPHYFSFMMKRDFFAFFFMILAFLEQWKLIIGLMFIGSAFILLYSFLLTQKELRKI